MEHRHRAEALLGEKHRIQLGERLHQVSALMRQPFLDFVAGVGAAQTDHVAWWSSGFSWKVWTGSDLFLLVCYVGLARAVIAEALASGERRIVIVEDPWLLRQLEENEAGNVAVRVQRRSGLWWEQARAIFRGAAMRVWWLLRVVLWQYFRHRWVWRGGRRRAPRRPTVALYTMPQRRCLREDGGWADPFLPDVDRLLEEAGYDVIRVVPPECGGFERELARRYQRFQPMIFYATAPRVWRALTAWWRPRWPERLAVGDVPVQWLAWRERWMEIGRSALCFYRMFYECFKAMLEAGEWAGVMYPYENQPWEKLIALAARARGVRTLGVQHSTLAANYLSYFLGRGEAARMPLPDVICTSGSYPHRLLLAGGNPPDRLQLCGSVRYPHLGSGHAPDGLPPLDAAPASEILVVLPIDRHMAWHLLAAIRRAFPAGGSKEGVRFHIKAHPSLPVAVEAVGFPAVAAPADFTEALQRCGLVLFIGSTAGPEALAMGRMVVRYRPELLLDVDPSEVFQQEMRSCHDGNLRDVILSAAVGGGMAEAACRSRVRSSELFAPLNRGMLKDLLRAEGPAAGSVS